jgi:hypothetical protein
MKEYTMNEAQYQKLLEACKPVMLIMLQCGMPKSPQENANDAWAELGKEMGFIWDTAEGTGKYTFNAEPLPTPGEKKGEVK